MKPVTCIINYDDNYIQLLNVDSDTIPIDDCLTNNDNGDELYFRDDDDCCEWIQIDLPCDNKKHSIQNYTSSDVVDILKPFKFLQLITIKNGRATICE